MTAPRAPIKIVYQGRPCAAGQMPMSLGILPDRGWVTMLRSEFDDAFALRMKAQGFVNMSDFGEIAMPHHMKTVLKLVQQRTAVVKGTQDPTDRGQAIDVVGKLVFDPSPGSGGQEPPGIVTLDHIYIDRQGLKEEDQDTDDVLAQKNLVRVQLTDIRSWWSEPGGVLWGDYNVRLSDTEFDQDTLKEKDTPYTLHEFLLYIMVALPGSPILEPDSVTVGGNFPPPENKRYRYFPAIAALKELLDDNGITLAPTHAGSFRVVPAWGPHEPYRFKKPGGQFFTIPPGSTSIETSSAHNNPAPAVMVIGTANYQIVQNALVPVYQDTDGTIQLMTKLPDRWGYSLEAARKQVMKSDQFQFDDISDADPVKKEEKKKIAKAWFFRAYQIAELADQTLEDNRRAPRLPIGPWYDKDEKRMRKPQVLGITYRQVVHPDPKAMLDQMTQAIDSISEKIRTLERMLEFATTHKRTLIDQQFAAVDGLAALRTADSVEVSAEFKTQDYDLVRLRDQIADRTLDQQEYSRQKEALTTLAEAKIARLTELGKSYAAKKFPKVWATQPFGVIPEDEYSIIPEYGIITFNRPFGPLSAATEGAMNSDQLELADVTEPIVKYGAPMDTGKPMDWFSAVFSGPNATQIAVNMPVTTRCATVTDKALFVWFDEKGEPIAEIQDKALEAAKKKAEPILSRPGLIYGAKYVAEGFWPVEPSADIRTVVFSSAKGDDCFTLIAANTDNESLDGFPSHRARQTVSAWEETIRRQRGERANPDGAHTHL